MEEPCRPPTVRALRPLRNPHRPQGALLGRVREGRPRPLELVGRRRPGVLRRPVPRPRPVRLRPQGLLRGVRVRERRDRQRRRRTHQPDERELAGDGEELHHRRRVREQAHELQRRDLRRLVAARLPGRSLRGATDGGQPEPGRRLQQPRPDQGRPLQARGRRARHLCAVDTVEDDRPE